MFMFEFFSPYMCEFWMKRDRLNGRPPPWTVVYCPFEISIATAVLFPTLLSGEDSGEGFFIAVLHFALFQGHNKRLFFFSSICRPLFSISLCKAIFSPLVIGDWNKCSFLRPKNFFLTWDFHETRLDYFFVFDAYLSELSWGWRHRVLRSQTTWGSSWRVFRAGNKIFPLPTNFPPVI